MASLITVRRWLGPRLELIKTLASKDATEQITQYTGLTRGEIIHVLYELGDLLVRAARVGQPVHLEGLGTFTPSLTRSGELRLRFRAGPEMKKKLSWKHQIRAKITNKSNIGATDEELVVQWNELHPEDPVSLPVKV